MGNDISLVRFYRLIEGTHPPQRADRSACGTLPTRAFRYCEAATSASAFGWWIFPPMDLTLMWDGSDIFWTFHGVDDWLPLQPSAQYPDFADAFDLAAPPDLRGCSPPMLTALPEPGSLQIWTGLIARTRPDWHLLVRAPANLPAQGGYALYEGIVETDAWFGPLFTNLRFTRTHVPVRLRADFPLAQAQPVPRIAYENATLSSMSMVDDMTGLESDDWADYRTTIVEPNRRPGRPHGGYAVGARKRRQAAEGPVATGGCPFSEAAAVRQDHVTA
jgi:hypothetical protein